MKTGPLLLLSSIACVTLLAACDDPTPARRPAASTQAASRPADPASQPAETRRISLLAIPFTAEVPRGWDVRSGAGNKIVLNGKTPDGGEVDVILSTRDRIKAESLPAMLAKLKATAAAPSADIGAPRQQITERDTLTIIEQTERLGPSNQPADLVPFQWTIQIIVPESQLEYSLFELNVADLSQLSFERNEAFLRKMIDSLQYDRSATPPDVR